jgi:DNA-binding FadR family transcriptional regulator
MAEALASQDAVAFVHANWQLHAQLAAVSPNQMLRALYGALLDLIEGHTLSVLPTGETPLPGYLEERYRLHADLVAALERRDSAEARRLIAAHSTQA